MNRNELRPLHHSIFPRLIRKPNNMEKVQGLDRDLCDDLERIAVSIFTDSVNVGVPFGRAILAVYLSGLQHGDAISKEED